VTASIVKATPKQVTSRRDGHSPIRAITDPVEHDDLVQVGVLAFAMDTHRQLFDARVRVSDFHDFKRFAFVDPFEQRGLEAVLENKLDRAYAVSVGLAEADLFEDRQLLEVEPHEV
jgi:hypothetical protein